MIDRTRELVHGALNPLTCGLTRDDWVVGCGETEGDKGLSEVAF